MPVTRAFRVIADEETKDEEVKTEKAVEVQRDPEAWHTLFQLIYGVYYAAQAGHWNIVGSRFNDLHSFFGSEYELWAGHVDTVAEHLRQHPGNQLLPASLPTLAEGLRSVEPTSDENEALKNLQLYLNITAKVLVAKNETLKHPVDVDLLGELARAVSKSLWKIESILGEKKA